MPFEALGNKLYLLGGCSWHKDDTDEVFLYDPSAKKWEEASTMQTARCYFESGALDDKLYVTGGLGLISGCSADWESWDFYGPQSNIWSSHTDPMLVIPYLAKSTFEKKMFTICNKASDDSYYTRLYDPKSRNWEDLKNEIVSCWFGPTVVVDGALYMLGEALGTRLMMWQQKTKDWFPLGMLLQTRPPCQLAAVGRSIFVIGQGLSVVVIDLDKAAKVRGTLVTSSFTPKLDDDLSVVSCKSIAI